jgi:hypothetical protein
MVSRAGHVWTQPEPIPAAFRANTFQPREIPPSPAYAYASAGGSLSNYHDRNMIDEIHLNNAFFIEAVGRGIRRSTQCRHERVLKFSSIGSRHP